MTFESSEKRYQCANTVSFLMNIIMQVDLGVGTAIQDTLGVGTALLGTLEVATTMLGTLNLDIA